MTDAELIRRAREENCAEAWNALAQRYLPVVWRYAYALVHDRHTAEDVASEAMLAFLRHLEQVDADTERISAWLRAVVRHKIADHHRRTYRAKNHLPQVALQHEQLNGEGDPSAPLITDEHSSQIVAVLDRMPERQRLALEWKYLEGLRVREIAERLGETEKAVEATLYRARREFRRLYELLEISETASPG